MLCEHKHGHNTVFVVVFLEICHNWAIHVDTVKGHHSKFPDAHDFAHQAPTEIMTSVWNLKTTRHFPLNREYFGIDI